MFRSLLLKAGSKVSALPRISVAVSGAARAASRIVPIATSGVRAYTSLAKPRTFQSIAVQRSTVLVCDRVRHPQLLPMQRLSTTRAVSTAATDSAASAVGGGSESGGGGKAAIPVTVTDSVLSADQMTPKEIVDELSKYIIGQSAAKEAVAQAICLRWRRRQLSPAMQSEVHPMNILLMGPTGSGKTEIARRLAKLVKAPFVKVELTKYTEAGFQGAKIESIIKELAENGISLERQKRRAAVTDTAREHAEFELVNVLYRNHRMQQTKSGNKFKVPVVSTPAPAPASLQSTPPPPAPPPLPPTESKHAAVSKILDQFSRDIKQKGTDSAATAQTEILSAAAGAASGTPTPAADSEPVATATATEETASAAAAALDAEAVGSELAATVGSLSSLTVDQLITRRSEIEQQIKVLQKQSGGLTGSESYEQRMARAFAYSQQISEIQRLVMEKSGEVEAASTESAGADAGTASDTAAADTTDALAPATGGDFQWTLRPFYRSITSIAEAGSAVDEEIQAFFARLQVSCAPRCLYRHRYR